LKNLLFTRLLENQSLLSSSFDCSESEDRAIILLALELEFSMETMYRVGSEFI